MERDLPPWLDEAFLATVLQGGEGREPRVTVLNFSGKLAVAPGNNYLSHIFRVTVEYEQEGEGVKNTTLMVKAPITKGVMSDMTDKMDVFGKEMRVYSEVLPKLNDKLHLELNPKNFYCPVKALVLKDLNAEGYTMCNKREQLDLPHCRLALTRLAQFHAASVACHHESPGLVESVGEEAMFVEGEMLSTQFKPWLQMCVRAVAGTVADTEGCREGAQLMLDRAEELADSAIRLCRPREGRLNVLNHGDFWMNNMLFKHDCKGNVVDVKFIDFQMTRLSSPAMDLVYFVWISANEDVRGSKLRELFFDTYLKTLNASLEELGCEERMSEEDLEDELKNSFDWCLIAICSVLPMALCEAENAIDLEDVKEEDVFNHEGDKPDEKVMRVFKGNNFNASIPNIIKHFYQWVSSFN